MTGIILSKSPQLGKEKAMAILGKYCKTCPLHLLRQYPAWTEKAENARKIRRELKGEIVEEVRELTDDTYVYVQADFTVTDGIFIDENIIFNDVTPEWIEFCNEILRNHSPVSAQRKSSEGGESKDQGK
jgi:hypothetical protein